VKLVYNYCLCPSLVLEGEEQAMHYAARERDRIRHGSGYSQLSDIVKRNNR
jgi:hypothetical protein